MKKLKLALVSMAAVGLISGAFIAIPSIASAALTDAQMQAIISLLQSFGADQSVVNNVQTNLTGKQSAVPQSVMLQPPQQEILKRPIAVFEQSQNIPNFNRDLFFGKSGDDIRDLQEFLTDQGYYAGPISSYYGLLTVQAIKKFQSANGINPTGYFGSRSRAIASEIFKKLVSQICSEEGCEGGVLPAEKLSILANTDLRGAVGEYFSATFSISGGSGNYMIDAEGVVAGLNWGKAACEVGKECKNNFVQLNGVPIQGGVYNVVVFAKDDLGNYGKERFTIVIKDKVSVGQPPIISGVKGPTTLKIGEEGIWTVEASDPNNGSLNYKVIWGDEVYGLEAQKELAPRAIPFKQTATFSHVYYKAGIYNPGFYIVNDHGSEAKTSISVNVVGETQIEPSIKIASDPPSTYDGKVTLKIGDKLMITGYPSNLSGTMLQDYSRAFIFDPIFNNACGNTEWVMTCTAKQAGVSKFYIELYKNGKTYRSNVIEVTVVGTTQPSITVLSPNWESLFKVGNTMTINWRIDGQLPSNWTTDANGIPDVIVYLYKGDQFIQFISTWHSGGGPMYWTIPSLDSGNDYKIKVSARGPGDIDLKYFDSSDAPFSIVTGGASTNNPPIINGFPAIPSSIKIGQSVSFSWGATDADGDNLSWSVSWGDGIGIANACQSPNQQNKQNWTFNTSHAWQNAGTYAVKATVNDCRGGSNEHAFNVITVGDSIQFSIAVLSPNGGESWQTGSVQYIKLSSNLLKESVSLYLYRNTGYGDILVQSIGSTVTSGDGSASTYVWTVPTSLAVGGGYKIYAVLNNVNVGKEIGDLSDSMFSIAGSGL